MPIADWFGATGLPVPGDDSLRPTIASIADSSSGTERSAGISSRLSAEPYPAPLLLRDERARARRDAPLPEEWEAEHFDGQVHFCRGGDRWISLDTIRALLATQGLVVREATEVLPGVEP